MYISHLAMSRLMVFHYEMHFMAQKTKTFHFSFKMTLNEQSASHVTTYMSIRNLCNLKKLQLTMEKKNS